MTLPLFGEDAYLKEAPAKIIALSGENGVILDRSIYYPTGGGQPGDTGSIVVNSDTFSVEETIKGENGNIILLLADGLSSLNIGDSVTQFLNWDMRYAHMKVHTALHLLSVVIPLPVTGGAITALKGRLDFNMPEAIENKDELTDKLNQLILADYEITESWISDEELDANPGLVKTMSVKPPTGAGRVRLVRIGNEDAQIDLQPCGGTHVKRTSEIGMMHLGKMQKKGQLNRRVNINFSN
jgi:misacylated tRNA(Ala) deacylase